MDKTMKLRPAQFPATLNEFDAFRDLTSHRTINDQVEDVIRAMYADKQFRAYLDAVYDEDAVEGSLSADNLMAAQLIRAKAKAMNNEELGSKKLATISKALGVVLRRYNHSRKQRKNMVGGEIVPSDDNGVE